MSKNKDSKWKEMEGQLRKEATPYDYNTREYPLEVLVKKFQDGDIIIPEYQRKLVWDNEMKSRFIESLLLGVPIMPILISESRVKDKESGDKLVLEVVDGTQRLRTLVDFCENKFALRCLHKLPAFEKTKFKDWTEYRQGKFKIIDLRIQIVTDKATPQVRADIFNRLNTSGKKLTSSEIRKGSLRGNLYDIVLGVANNERFNRLCPVSKKIDRGEREELALRFFVYSRCYLEFKHDVTKFLDQKLYEFNLLSKSQIGEMRADFERVLKFVEKYFPSPYFASPQRAGSTARVRFEAIAVGVYLAIKEKPDLASPPLAWLDSDAFKKETTTDASNNPGRLKSRIEFVRDQLLGG